MFPGAFSVVGFSIGGKTLTAEKGSRADGGIGVRKTLSLYVPHYKILA
jgi:hypothetical protein